jgi:hypothetical protein
VLKDKYGHPVPQIGQIVHYYTHDKAEWFNGVGEGPYPAIITQVFNLGSMEEKCNLKVLPPFGPVRDVGSVARQEISAEFKYNNCFDWPPPVGFDYTKSISENFGGNVPKKVAVDDR